MNNGFYNFKCYKNAGNKFPEMGSIRIFYEYFKNGLVFVKILNNDKNYG